MNNITSPIIHDRHIVKQYFNYMIENQIHKNKFKIPNDLTIATCRNNHLEDRIIDSLSGYEHKSILEYNLEYLGMDGLVLLIDDRRPWRYTFKIEILKNYLDRCTTKYFMSIDCIDAIFIDDPNTVLQIFQSFDCKMLFMTTHGMDGYSNMPEVKQWVDSIHPGRYLNAGVWIGETAFVKEVLNEASKYITPHGITADEFSEYHKSGKGDYSQYPIGSTDQDIFRYIEPKFYPHLKVDSKNKLAFRK